MSARRAKTSIKQLRVGELVEELGIHKKKEKSTVRFIEVQVKFGTLSTSAAKWYKFSCHSWKFFNFDEFATASPDLYVASVLSEPNNYKGGIFIFPSQEFHQLINKAVKSQTQKGIKAKFMIAHDPQVDKWFLCTKSFLKTTTTQTALT